MHKVKCFCFRVDIYHRDFTMTVFRNIWLRSLQDWAQGLDFSNSVTIRASEPIFIYGEARDRDHREVSLVVF